MAAEPAPRLILRPLVDVLDGQPGRPPGAFDESARRLVTFPPAKERPGLARHVIGRQHRLTPPECSRRDMLRIAGFLKRDSVGGIDESQRP